MHPTNEDKDLLMQCRQGNKKAQFVLYDRYVTAMYNVAMRIVANRAGAEDVLQDSFLKVFVQLHTLQNEMAITAWIKRIVVTTALNHLRRVNKIQFVEIQPFHDLPEEVVEWEEIWDARSIHEAIQQLPDGCRVIFNLYAMEEMSHKDIAVMLGISESTSKTQYMRAKKLLRQQLQAIKTNNENASVKNQWLNHGSI